MRHCVPAAGVASLLLVAACTDAEHPSAPSLNRQEAVFSAAGGFVDLPAISVELPPQPRSWDTDEQALTDAVASGEGYAIVAFKEPGSLRLKDTGLRAAVTGAAVEAGVKLVEGLDVEVTAHLKNMGAVVVKMSPLRTLTLSRHPLVDYIEPRQKLEVDGVRAPRPASVAQGSQTQPWGVSMIHAPSVWSTTTTGSGAKVLVIDAPYFRGHEDLPVIPLGNCGNDGCSPGSFSHGTFVLGEIVARANGVGTIGVAHGVETVNVFFWKACDDTGVCPNDLIVQGIDQGISWGVHVVNMSFGGVYDLAIAEAAQRAWYADIVLVASAGNCWDADPDECSTDQYPAALTGVIGVSGVRDNALFANTSPCVDPFGNIRTSRWGWSVDVAAPFWSRSAVNTGGYEDEQDFWCGTSMAAPFVTGTVALMRAKNPTIPNWQIQNILLSNAEDRGAPGWDVYYGDGIVRADNAVGAVPPLLQASIAGPSEVQQNYPCNWAAQVGGGAGGYTIQWSGVLSGTGYQISGSLSSSGVLYLDVTDSAGNTDGDQLYITVSQSAPECGL